MVVTTGKGPRTPADFKNASFIILLWTDVRAFRSSYGCHYHAATRCDFALTPGGFWRLVWDFQLVFAVGRRQQRFSFLYGWLQGPKDRLNERAVRCRLKAM